MTPSRFDKVLSLQLLSTGHKDLLILLLLAPKMSKINAYVNKMWCKNVCLKITEIFLRK